MIRIKICIFLAFIGVYTTSYAQTDAKKVINKVSSAFNQAGGIQADFSIQFLKQGKPQGNSQGQICIKASKFALKTPDTASWFDGKTLWTYMASSEEVNVSSPTHEELQGINPYLILNNYRNEYDCSLGSKTSYQQIAIYELRLIPIKKRYDIATITLYVNKQTYQPLFIELMHNNGYTSRFIIHSYKTKQTFDDNIFKFDTRKYPSAEVIDLR